jgi:hypothetical protein
MENMIAANRSFPLIPIFLLPGSLISVDVYVADYFALPSTVPVGDAGAGEAVPLPLPPQAEKPRTTTATSIANQGILFRRIASSRRGKFG